MYVPARTARFGAFGAEPAGIPLSPIVVEDSGAFGPADPEEVRQAAFRRWRDADDTARRQTAAAREDPRRFPSAELARREAARLRAAHDAITTPEQRVELAAKNVGEADAIHRNLLALAPLGGASPAAVEAASLRSNAARTILADELRGLPPAPTPAPSPAPSPLPTRSDRPSPIVSAPVGEQTRPHRTTLRELGVAALLLSPAVLTLILLRIPPRTRAR